MGRMKETVVDLFDYIESRAQRDRGIERVLGHNEEFKLAAAIYIDRLPHGWTGTGEDIRRGYLQTNGPTPSHHNAWGGVVNSALKRGVLEKTGIRTGMQAVKSHARSTDIYRRV